MAYTFSIGRYLFFELGSISSTFCARIFCSQNLTPILENSTWRMAHIVGEFWLITLAFNFVGEIEQRIFLQTGYNGVFLLGKNFLWNQTLVKGSMFCGFVVSVLTWHLRKKTIQIWPEKIAKKWVQRKPRNIGSNKKRNWQVNRRSTKYPKYGKKGLALKMVPKCTKKYFGMKSEANPIKTAFYSSHL